jgi:hypothetical protein
MPVLTDLASAAVKRGTRLLYGTVLSRPALLVTDGLNLVYACDVNIGPTDSTGRIEQYKRNKKTGGSEKLEHLPGQDSWHLADSITVNTVMHNVAINRANRDLIYADVGAPVRLERTDSGQWEIMGFAIEQPWTVTLVPVNLDDLTIGTIGDFTISTRLLSLGELGTFDDFGNLPFGARAIFVGNTLQRIV